MAPPFSSKVFASTAMPWVETLGSATVWAKVSVAVPLPLP